MLTQKQNLCEHFLIVDLNCSDLNLQSPGNFIHCLSVDDTSSMLPKLCFVYGLHLLRQSHTGSLQATTHRTRNQHMGWKRSLLMDLGCKRHNRYDRRECIRLIIADNHRRSNTALLAAVIIVTEIYVINISAFTHLSHLNSAYRQSALLPFSDTAQPDLKLLSSCIWQCWYGSRNTYQSDSPRTYSQKPYLPGYCPQPRE